MVLGSLVTPSHNFKPFHSMQWLQVPFNVTPSPKFPISKHSLACSGLVFPWYPPPLNFQPFLSMQWSLIPLCCVMTLKWEPILWWGSYVCHRIGKLNTAEKVKSLSYLLITDLILLFPGKQPSEITCQNLLPHISKLNFWSLLINLWL